ncbi:MAG: MoaD/ThiS family protein [Candidatus Hodarchaeales archaeon]|jgi:MoaD family protein
MAGEIKILFHATFREITRKREIIERINENCNVAFILRNLSEQYGKDFNSIIDPDTGKISSEFLILLNGRPIREVDTELTDSDVLIITIPVGGG